MSDAAQEEPQQPQPQPQPLSTPTLSGESPPLQPQGNSALSSPSAFAFPHDSRSDTNSRSNMNRPQDFPSAADLRCSFSHSHMARPLEIMESIKGLHELHQQGGLTQAEFTQAKQQILDSGSSVTSVPSTKSKRSRTRRHRRRGRHGSRNSSTSTASRGPRGNASRSSDDRSHAKTKSTRHRSSRSGRTRKSSKDSSSSSDSSSDRFIVVPRANVWRSLNARLEDDNADHESSIHHLATSAHGYAEMHSPLLAAPGTGSSGFRVVRGDGLPYMASPPPQSSGCRADGYEAVPGDDPLSRGMASPCSTDALLPSPNTAGIAGTVRSGSGGGVTSAGTGSCSAAAVAAAAAALGVHPNSLTGSDSRDKGKYGTLLSREDAIRVGDTSSVRAELNREDIVRVKYFNSRGRAGSHFSDVELHTSELREPVFLQKGHSQVVVKPADPSSASGTRHGKDDTVLVAMPTHDSEVFQLTDMTPDARRAWEEMTNTSTGSTTSPSSKSSFLEQSLNWYWIDVTGRDPSRRRYNTVLRLLTNRFKLCGSFLVDRDHTLVLPQVCESPNYPGQYLLNLRVATDKIAISDDSVMELTNRWIIVVDLKQHVVITLHRVDTHSMANLRMLWRKVIENSDVSFQEFLLKIIDDAIRTYQTSIDVHADILDKCEAKLFVETSTITVPVPSGHYVDMRILHHFAGSSRSPFLRRLLDDQDRSPMKKGEMNSFLHHLHRRTSVQHRMLNLTQTVLVKAFTKLRLCSREMADQMCASCIEVSDRALEVRDDAKTLLDLHISLQSFRTNELMAVLTRVSLLFTPVTFLAGVYGMNFQKNFPELTWEYGYPCFWAMCLVLVCVMQVFFLREK